MQLIGRYALFDEIARGGMATVHIGRLLGQGGFSRTVAIKRLHPHLAKDPEFVTMLLDEARLAARIQHPCCVSMLDVVASDGELMIVMEHVQGESLMKLIQLAKRRGEVIPPAIAVAVAVSALRGLHAAHEVKGESGEPLLLVHRDVTPHNIMVRPDGTAVILDFGVAKAAGRFHTTEEGRIKGKLPYMAPEQLRGEKLDRKVDLYAAGCVLYETLAGRRVFAGASEAELLGQVLMGQAQPPSTFAKDIPPTVDAIVMKTLARDPIERYATAAELADALERSLTMALASEVGAWVTDLASDSLVQQASRVREIESGSRVSVTDLESAMRAIEATSAESGTTGSRTTSPLLTTKSEDAATVIQLSTSDLSAASLAKEAPPEIGSSTASSMTRAALSEPKPAPSGARWLPWALVALLAGAIPTVWLATRDASSNGSATTSTATAAALATTTIATATSTATEAVTAIPAETASAAESAMPSPAEPSSTASAPPIAHAPIVAPTTVRTPTTAATPTPAAGSCVTVGPDGRKKYDRACLKGQK